MLPTPSPEAIVHSQQLQQLIRSEINASNGKISFARYMELALYAPGLGYYSAGSQKFGKEGDFITAPHISALFSKCLANQCQQVLSYFKDLGSILEVGAGTGQMAADILLALEQMDQLPNHYFILELSAELKLRQQQKIQALCPHLLSRIKWLDSLPEPGFQGIVLANELLDAMPVSRFQIIDNALFELFVCENNNNFKCKPFVTKNEELLDLFHSQSWANLYTSEINLTLKPWISSISDILTSGVILLVDYGFPAKEYYHPDRADGTLMCHYQHHAHSDPFFFPGLQDITAHVDFSAIAKAGTDANLDILGFTQQASFLMSCGLIELLQQNANNALSTKEQAMLNHAITVLTSPAEMGELFKVIALGRNFEELLIGFELNDRQFVL